jgi:hypothetical protein
MSVRGRIENHFARLRKSIGRTLYRDSQRGLRLKFKEGAELKATNLFGEITHGITL